MSVEKKAIEIAKEYLESQGLIVKPANRGSGYDLEGDDGSAWEVKGTSSKVRKIDLIAKEYGAMQTHPNWHLIFVTGVNGSPKVFVLSRNAVLARGEVSEAFYLPLGKQDLEQFRVS